MAPVREPTGAAWRRTAGVPARITVTPGGAAVPGWVGAPVDGAGLGVGDAGVGNGAAVEGGGASDEGTGTDDGTGASTPPSPDPGGVTPGSTESGGVTSGSDGSGGMVTGVDGSGPPVTGTGGSVGTGTGVVGAGGMVGDGTGTVGTGAGGKVTGGTVTGGRVVGRVGGGGNWRSMGAAAARAAPTQSTATPSATPASNALDRARPSRASGPPRVRRIPSTPPPALLPAAIPDNYRIGPARKRCLRHDGAL
jgi:hypothetical protein